MWHLTQSQWTGWTRISGSPQSLRTTWEPLTPQIPLESIYVNIFNFKKALHWGHIYSTVGGILALHKVKQVQSLEPGMINRAFQNWFPSEQPEIITEHHQVVIHPSKTEKLHQEKKYTLNIKEVNEICKCNQDEMIFIHNSLPILLLL